MADPTVSEAVAAVAPGAGTGFFAGSLAAFVRWIGPVHAGLSAIAGGFFGGVSGMAAREWFDVGFWTAIGVSTVAGLCAIPAVNGLLRAADAFAADPWGVVGRFWPGNKSGGK